MADKMTNADRIRSMTDEEIAHFIANLQNICLCEKCEQYVDGLCYVMVNKNRECKQEEYEATVVKWLQSECEV